MAKYSGSPFVQWRKRADVSGTELALALGISKTHLSDLERGTVSISPGLLERISELSGIDAEQFQQDHIAWMEKRKSAVMEKLKVE